MMFFNNWNDNHGNGAYEDDDDADDCCMINCDEKALVRTISQRLCSASWCVTVWGTGAWLVVLL